MTPSQIILNDHPICENKDCNDPSTRTICIAKENEDASYPANHYAFCTFCARRCLTQFGKARPRLSIVYTVLDLVYGPVTPGVSCPERGLGISKRYAKYDKKISTSDT